LKTNPTFRELANEHKKYETRLSELAELHYPNDEEQLEEVLLKKKKLAVKDEMYSMLNNYYRSQSH
jgi:uncharacterized protein YdcH (DUF465 family)